VAQRGSTGAVLLPAEEADRRRGIARARAALGDTDFERAWTKGAAMTLEEAAEYASSTRGTAEIVTPHLSLVDSAMVALTPREREVAALIARGLTNREIASDLIISVRTVERHIENLHAKLGVSGGAARATVATFATRHRLTVQE
jgi:DNA-binding NarL/FixJ family response regulator